MIDDDRDSPDIAAMCREAGVPVDDSGVKRLIDVVARHCAGICERMEPEGDIDHIERRLVKQVGAEIAVKMSAVFQLY